MPRMPQQEASTLPLPALSPRRKAESWQKAEPGLPGFVTRGERGAEPTRIPPGSPPGSLVGPGLGGDLPEPFRVPPGLVLAR